MIKHSRKHKNVALFLLFTFLFQILLPSTSWALTGGPSQPEVQSFEPIGTSQMVDPFTGDFTYNLPLLDVGGYPINMSYHSGVTMDQEASWVGLGWNINPGAINRNLRGLPDDFNGDKITTELNMKKNWTVGLNGGLGLELFGIDGAEKLGLRAGLGLKYNSYTGVSSSLSASLSMNPLGDGGTALNNVGMGLGMTSSSDDGLTVSPTVSYSRRIHETKSRNNTLGVNLGVSMHSRKGLSNMSLGVSSDFNELGVNKKGNKAVSGSSSIGHSSSISFIPNTYIPQQTMAFENGSFSASFKVGLEGYGAMGSFDLGAYYSYQTLKEKVKSSPSFGYLNAQNAKNNDQAIHDFNREKDGAFSPHKANLPVTNFTYDLFGITGQGIGGMFRAHRGDVGHVYDPLVKNTSASFNAGFEMGVPGIVKAGLDRRVNSVKSFSGPWVEGNDALHTKQFKQKEKGDLFEPTYFKMTGERSAEKGNWESEEIGVEPQNVQLTGSGYHVKAGSGHHLKSKSTTEPSTQLKKSNREQRNQAVYTLNKKEVLSGMGVSSYTNAVAGDNHIAEITVLRTDGSRYIYGKPAYNTFKKDVTFNVSGNQKNCATGLVSYKSSEASVENKKGDDNYFQSTSTPPYAHSYLMTCLLGSNYSDLDGIKGPSLGDIGSWVKFDYGKLPRYKWRVPFMDHKASYNEGLKSNASDDKGSYIYGEKELFYLTKIESKTHIAVFQLSNREDGYGVQSEHGGGLGANMRKLDKISLYTRKEYTQHENDLSQATPIKEVHFEYDYSLCQGVPNRTTGSAGNNGKLTLKKVYFTYRNSYKAKFSAYTFNYADLNHDGVMEANANPDYNLKAYDRWGHYKPNSGSCDVSSSITAPEFPYVEQDKAATDVFQAAWSLTDISLPSGGKIKIDYESDDYGYVQNKRAMQMFKVVGTGDNAFDEPKTTLYDGDNPYEYIFFKLQEPVSNTTNVSWLREKYLHDIDDNRLYFRFLVNLNDQPTNGNHDFVSGYADLDDLNPIGFTNYNAQDGNYTHGYLKVKKVKKGDKSYNDNDTHPIARAAWNFARVHNPRLAFNTGTQHLESNPGKFEIEDVVYSLWDSFDNFAEFFRGPNGHMRSKKFGRRFIPAKSWVRLYNPSGNKLGGGVRVKQITMSDSWNNMTSSGTEAEYGQEYAYVNDDGTSSGVAAYEPLIGGDENPFRLPVFFEQQQAGLTVPSSEHYIEKPIGESFFPSPSVGYGRVEVKNLQYNNVKNHATGKIVHEFYTAKDFPTRVDETPIDLKHKPASFGSKMLKFSVKDHITASQGYSIETNDMHGKPKAQWVYAEGQNSYLSGIEYKYKTKLINQNILPGYNETQVVEVLDNGAQVLFPDNDIKNVSLGVDIDMIHDFRINQTNSMSAGVDVNSDAFLAGIIPIVIPTVYPSYAKSELKFRSAVTSKLVNRFGLIDETVVYDNNAVIRTKNLLYDGETGEVLLTQVENEFGDPVYSFSYPAHVIYEGMGSAYKNIGYTEEITALNTTGVNEGRFSMDASTSNFYKGDELMLVNTSTQNVSKGWVWQTEDEYSQYLYLIDKEGLPITGTYDAKIIRSGYRNLSTASIGNIASKQNPITDNSSNKSIDISQAKNILNASAVEYSEKWQMRDKVVDKESGTVTTTALRCVANPDPILENDLRTAVTHLIETIINHQDASGVYKPLPLSHLTTFSNSTLTNFDVSVLEANCNYPLGNHGVWLAYRVYWNNGAKNKLHLDFRSEVPNYKSNLGITAYFGGSAIPTWGYVGGGFMEFSCSLDQVEGLNPLVDVVTYDEFCEGTDIRENIQDAVTARDPGTNQVFNADIIHLPQFPFKLFDRERVEVCPLTPELLSTGNNGSLNPFVWGLRGNWQAKNTYAYNSERQYSSLVQIKDDGYYTNFHPFWNNGPSFFSKNTSTAQIENWISASTLTMSDEFGNPVEQKDALGNYSCALYDPTGSLMIANGANAKHGQLAFDGFEQYDGVIPMCPEGQYFGIAEELDDGIYELSNTVSHTGKASLIIDPEASVDFNFSYDPAAKQSANDNMPYTVKRGDAIENFGSFETSDETEFVISYWINRENSSANSFDDISLELVDKSGSPFQYTGLSVTKKSAVIEGWQKVEHRFSLSGVARDLAFSFSNSAGIRYFMDDLRIQPSESTMKSYVYDSQNMRLVAELDENNYGTLYEYDEEGALIRVKKETSRGIKTIQESRNHKSK